MMTLLHLHVHYSDRLGNNQRHNIYVFTLCQFTCVLHAARVCTYERLLPQGVLMSNKVFCTTHNNKNIYV